MMRALVALYVIGCLFSHIALGNFSLFENSLLWSNTLRKLKVEEDRIERLPGLAVQPTFAQYSGYLSGSTPNIQLHYWFVESSRDPERDPLVLWLNGGPGCSSLEGLLDENGPFNIQRGSTLVPNPYSWNTIANVLYLEAPAGVGFSYAADGNTTTDDDFTSLNNYHALVHFLEKFPQYKGRDFYITGESYAGVYVPTLALRVLKSKNKFRLKGIAVGNGLTNYQMNDNSLVYFIMYHALIDESLWSETLGKCCFGQSDTKCMFSRNDSDACQKLLAHIHGDVIDGLNVYNLYDKCAGGAESKSTLGQLITNDLGNLFRNNPYVQMKRKKQNRLRRLMKGPMVLPCVDSSLLVNYLNLPEVRDALHVNFQFLEPWDVCSPTINSEYIRTYSELSAQYLEILRYRVPTLIYNGDVDMACNYFGDLWFVDSLGLQTERNMTHWLFTDEDQTKQVGGIFKILKYRETPLWYATVRGSGHMVPHDKPIQALHLIKRFISGQPLNS